MSPRVLERRDGEQIAFHQVQGSGPTVVWMGGFASDMEGTKALALDAWARASGRAYLRFDYYGHGSSSGDFALGTIRRWREDALAVIDELTDGPLVLVGSSMGGWIACLAALVRKARIQGLALVAPAADFTSALMEPGLPPEARQALAATGRWRPPYAQGDTYAITQALLDDGRDWLVLPGPVAISAPVRILQGGRDEAVPWSHALALAEAIQSPDLVFSLVREGDHRLSRPKDLARLITAVEELSN